MPKEQQTKTMLKEVKEVMMMIFHQTENINKEVVIKKN